MQQNVPHLYSREAEEQFRQQSLQNNQHFCQQQLLGGGPRPVFGGEKSALVQQIQALENGYGEENGAQNYGNVYFEKAEQHPSAQNGRQQQDTYWTYEGHQRMPSHIQQRVQSPSPPRQLYRQGQQPQQHEQFIQYQEAYAPYTRQQLNPQQNTWVGAVNDVYDGTFPSGPPPVFTTELLQQAQSVHYKSAAERRRAESERARRHHSPVEGASERGYLFGGMDYIDHASPTQAFNPNNYEYEQGEHRSRRDDPGPPRRPNDFYGLDYSTLASAEQHAQVQEDTNYKGYVAQQPRKHWLYTADPKAPLNHFEAELVESVDPVKLIGDTLSNQKIDVAQELTEEEKNTFGTTYAPPPGFKPQHRTVLPEPQSPEPICFSLSARKEMVWGADPPHTSTPGSRCQKAMVVQPAGPLSAQDNSWYTAGNKEIMRNEPNWSRNVNQRRSAWETQSKSVDSRMQLPSWVKVPPQQPPYWAGRANTTHNVWQSAADKGYIASGNYNTGYNSTNNPAGNAPQQQHRQLQMTGQTQPAQNVYVEERDFHPAQHHAQKNQVDSNVYIKEQYRVAPSAQEHHHQRQVYYHERPEEHHYQRQVYYHEQPEEQGVDYNRVHTHKPEYVDQHHQLVMQQAVQQTAPQHHSTSSTTNLINQTRGSQPNLGSGQKQSSTTTTSNSYYTQQPQPPYENYGVGAGKADYSSTNKVLPSSRSQSHNISSSSHSSQRVGGQVGQQYVGQPNQQAHNLEQQGKQEKLVYQHVQSSPQTQRKAGPAMAQQPPQRNNYQRIIANKQINKEGVASRYPPSRQQDQHSSNQYDLKTEMAEILPQGQLSHSYMNTSGQFQDRNGYDVNYRRELSSATNPRQEFQLLKQEERRVVDEPVQEQPGIISSF